MIILSMNWVSLEIDDISLSLNLLLFILFPVEIA